jgi:hypothetical protein
MTGEWSWSVREWKEGQYTLEEQIPAILDKLESKRKRMTVEQQERGKRWAERAEKERLQKEREQKQRAELAGFKDLLHKAARWREATLLRHYLTFIEQTVSAAGTLPPDLQTWLAWARAKADWYDPQLEGPDEWLAGIDRATLTIKW